MKKQDLTIYDIKILNADIKIYKDNVEKVIINHNGSFLVSHNENETKIEQLFFYNRKLKLATLSMQDQDNIEIILPNNSNNQTIIISSEQGNISLNKLNLKKLYIYLEHGNIKLEDVDSTLTDIILRNGNIIAEIRNSIFNYTTLTRGTCEQSTIENMNTNNIPVFSNDKHHLKINNDEGNIKILFKGKR